MAILIKIADEYTKTPGGRFKKDGLYSGEDFREKILLPRFLEAIQHNEELTVDLDGGYGYGTSFLEEAFGGLARITKNKKVLNINIISEEEPSLKDDIELYIKTALNKK